MTEHELEQAARRLGERDAARLDVDATARAVVARLREAPARPVRRAVPEWLRVAAAIALLLGAGVAVQRLSAPPAALPHALAVDLHDLTAGELNQILDGLDDTLADDAADWEPTDLDALTPAQLQALLRTLET